VADRPADAPTRVNGSIAYLEFFRDLKRVELANCALDRLVPAAGHRSRQVRHRTYAAHNMRLNAPLGRRMSISPARPLAIQTFESRK
jgi:hypothetical protein